MSESATDGGVTVTFTTSAAEQARVTREVVRFTWAWWLPLVVFSGVPTLLAGWLALVRQSSMAGPIILLLVAVTAIPFWTYGIAWIGVSTTRRGLPNPDGPISWTLTEAGSHVSGPSGSADIKWNAFICVRETRDFFLFYQGKHLAQFLPKRAMSSDQLPRVRDILRRVSLME